jgi:hypothetical protein
LLFWDFLQPGVLFGISPHHLSKNRQAWLALFRLGTGSL